MTMFIYSLDGIDIKRFSSKSARNRAAQAEVNQKYPVGQKVQVHYGVSRDGDDELCEGKLLTSK